MTLSLAGISNFDLLSVGVAVGAIALLGFLVYFNNRNSATNKAFLYLSLATFFWGISNYLEYKFTTIISTLWALRFHIFISTIHAFTFFQLAYVFPLEEIQYPKWYRNLIIPIVFVTCVLTLTPLVFSGIEQLAPVGNVTNPQRGFGIVLFSLVAFGLLLSGVFILFRKFLKDSGVQKRQTLFIFLGMFLMACLILLFNVVLPITFNNLSFIPYAALFILPFICLTFYSIYKYRLFNVKIVGVALVTFIFSVITFAEVVFSPSFFLIVLRSIIFLLVITFGILLLRGVLKEVEQREKIESLAHDLQIANEGQVNLMHIMNHQIKGRLGNAKNIFAELLTDDYGKLPDAAMPLIKKGIEETDSGVNYVLGILHGLSAKNGTLPYSMKDINLTEIVTNVVVEEQENAKRKNLVLSISNETKDTADTKMFGDPIQLKEAIKNLIENSIAYTLQGSIRVSLSIEYKIISSLDMNNTEKIIRLAIKDSGVGITVDDMKNLFKAGGRGKYSTKTNVNSTGYGLAFVKGVIDAHKGKVWAESKGENQGSEFYIELPVA